MVNSPGACAVDQEAAIIAGRIERALGDRNERAGAGRPFRKHRDAFEPLVVRQLVDRRRRRDRLPARQQAELAEIEAHDLVDAFDAEIGRAIVFGERFGVVPAACCRDRAPIRTEYRRHLGIRDADRNIIAIDDAAFQPAPAIRHREKLRAVGINFQAGNPAELFGLRGQFKPATKFQRAETVCATDRAARRPRSAQP